MLSLRSLGRLILDATAGRRKPSASAGPLPPILNCDTLKFKSTSNSFTHNQTNPRNRNAHLSKSRRSPVLTGARFRAGGTGDFSRSEALRIGRGGASRELSPNCRNRPLRHRKGHLLASQRSITRRASIWTNRRHTKRTRAGLARMKGSRRAMSVFTGSRSGNSSASIERECVKHDRRNGRFTLDLGHGQKARIDYRKLDGRSGKRIELYHTEVPEELRGRGIGRVLARGVFDCIEAAQLKPKVTCEFLKDYVRRFAEPRHKNLVLKEELATSSELEKK